MPPLARGRVLQVMEATIGGTKRHLLELAGGLRDSGWDVTVACPRVRGEAFGDVTFWDDLASAGVPARELAMERRPTALANARAVASLALLLRREAYDLVHAHSSIAGAVARPAALLAAGGRRDRRPAVVYTPHGFAFLAAQTGRRRSAFLAVERTLGGLTDRLIAVSATEADAAVEHGIVPRRRVATIVNGVAMAAPPPPGRRAEVRRREGWGGAPIVGTVARMTPQKDPQTWLEAAALLAASRPDVRFVWVWGGEQADDVRRRAAALGLADRLLLPGYRSDARDLIAAFDVFLLTSRFEGLPYTAIEALAVETPVVATDVVGTRDVVRHGSTGLLAPAGDAAGLARHVASLLDDRPLAGRLARAGRADVVARFSVPAMVAQTGDVYEALLAGRR